MNATHEELRLALGAYALGTLEPDEQTKVEAHLASCPACLLELDELLQTVPALASLSAADVVGPPPSDGLFDRIAEAVAHPAPADASARNRFASGRWLLTAAAAVVVLAGGGTAVGLAVSSDSSGPATTNASVSAGPIHLAVAASDASSGTRLVLSVRGLPQHEHCRLVARADDGSVHPAGTWNASYEGAATVVESTDVPRSDLHSLTLYGNGNRKLVAVNL